MTFPSMMLQHCTVKKEKKRKKKDCKRQTKDNHRNEKYIRTKKMCFLLEIFGTKKAKNRNNSVRLYRDVTQTRRMQLVNWLPVLFIPSNAMVRKTSKLFRGSIPKGHDEKLKITRLRLNGKKKSKLIFPYFIYKKKNSLCVPPLYSNLFDCFLPVSHRVPIWLTGRWLVSHVGPPARLNLLCVLWFFVHPLLRCYSWNVLTV